ncbi:MAG TPA: helix-hairpin-helix domain-containing protein, partial [Spirochaetota bacterium]|nr:helix-hairpin-helix domain-containing protein [Spirochaetota bacterium]
ISNFLDYSNVLSDFLSAYYLNNSTEFPKNVYLNEDFENRPLLVDGIFKKFNTKIFIKQPSDQKDKKILKLSNENAEIYFEEKLFQIEKIHSLRELKKVLNLPTLPRRIECFDIATLGGKFNTAAMVSFYDGKPDKSEYRQFNIEGEGHPDDYAMMEEVIARRYQRLKNEKIDFPDLIVVDGGKGQVTSASKSLSILDIKIPTIGLAKKEELIFLQDKKNPLILSKNSLALKLLQAIRDESHRFSNVRLNKRYKNQSLELELSKIENLGEKKINALLGKFKSLKKIKIASMEDLEQIDLIGKDTAKKIFEYFNHKKE